MKKVFYKIMAIAMAFVVLFTTMSFAINMHYCGDTLVETAIFEEVEGCGMAMDNPLSNDCSIAKKNCCEDKQVVVEGQDELQLTVDTLHFEQHVFVASFIYTYWHLFEATYKEKVSHKEYTPPLVLKDIYKVDETYLI